MIETVTMATIVAMVALFVLYPIYYLLQASLDVGLPDTRPPTAYGLANYAKLLDYPTVCWNTLVVTVRLDRDGAAVRLRHAPGSSRAPTCLSSARSIS